MHPVSKPNFIDIYQDGELIGNSELSSHGELLECRAPLADNVLEALEDAIESGRQQITVGKHVYSWSQATTRISRY